MKLTHNNTRIQQKNKTTYTHQVDNQPHNGMALKFFSACTLLTALSTISIVQAGDDQSAGFTLSPALGYISHDSDRQGLENTGTASIAAGYQFANPWAVEIAYLIAQPGIVNTSSEADASQLRLDGLYHFGGEGKAQPYAVFGIGESKFESYGSESTDTLVNAGLGVKYAFNDVVSMRTDLRAVQQMDSDALQMAFNLGVHMLLGGQSNSSSQSQAKDKDSDNDGIADRTDACPGTATGTPVDGSGCPIPQKPAADSDKDGVIDAKDECPDTKAGAKVTTDGCYQTLKEDVTVELDVSFANNSDQVISQSLSQIEKLAEFMRQFPATNVEIKGHTDDRGAASYNQQLSQKRASAVAKILSEQYGISTDRVSAIGLGETQPRASNGSPEGRASNRRVEATLRATVEKAVF